MIAIPRSPDYTRNSARAGKYPPCVICGKAVKHPRWYVRTFWDSHIVTDAQAQALIEVEGEGGDSGYHPVGADCAR